MAGRTKAEAIAFMDQMYAQNQRVKPFSCGFSANVKYICTDGTFTTNQY